jgi:hypothetical protein
MSPAYTPGKLILAQTYTPGDRYYNETSLLLHGNGSNGSTSIIDSSPNPKTVTAVGNAQISTAQSIFGGSSIAFDGTGDYLVAPASSAFTFNGAVENFTIELWSYWTGPSSGVNNAQLVGTAPVTSAYVNGGWLLATNGANYRWFNSLGQGGLDMPLTRNQWQHVAVVCNSGAIKMYVDGIGSAWTYSGSINYSFNGPLAVGAYNNTFVTGYITDLRITKNIARYTANFTPPPAAFADGYY